ncbi:SHOCT domain-containing protein [Paenarthrobacter sp. OM7]|uniref:SHOCT domain-containing protein n=1 Tax=Paenarthrobacter sp. AMU7 TaxID=3162492 RepID=A0AB39YRA2_9MICC|nr:SHOCT domain-containing protein [Paenarthrobacter sp. OM7]WGM20440.1 SHOCT domain-containing protein [Paenarthrobacter sp. OM7]
MTFNRADRPGLLGSFAPVTNPYERIGAPLRKGARHVTQSHPNAADEGPVPGDKQTKLLNALQQLATLHSSGGLSEAEFTAAKARLLS